MNDDSKKRTLMGLREMMKANPEGKREVSDEKAGIDQPALEVVKGGEEIISLTRDFANLGKNHEFMDLIENRSSRRKYTDGALTLDELSYLLWTTQGVKKVIGRTRKATIRTVPSAGARHPFETYLFINRVDGLEQGLYHYLALTHQLEFLETIEDQENRLSQALSGQTYFGKAPVVFMWSVVPYRAEWRYGCNAQKYALIDAGHICQNLYLVSESIGCGACAIGDYNQVEIDHLLHLQTSPSYEKGDEFAVYGAAVGRVESES